MNTMFLLLVFMSACLGLSSFGCGIVPLSFTLSKSYLDRLSALGTGFLLGAALGVIIPEGIEGVVEASPSHIPTTTISLSLLIGFTLMLVIEQLLSPHTHAHTSNDLSVHPAKPDSTNLSVTVEFDTELGELERDEGIDRSGYLQSQTIPPAQLTESVATSRRALPLTFGLVVHGLADGLALGVSSLAKDQSDGTSLSWIVFLALIIHKAPTSLALTTSLLATSLPREKCRKHLLVFAASTPVGALVSYLLFSFFSNGDDHWTGVALLLSGGTFLYVATVIQPVSEHNRPPAFSKARVFYIVFGVFIPFLLSSWFGHGH